MVNRRTMSDDLWLVKKVKKKKEKSQCCWVCAGSQGKKMEESLVVSM